MFFANHPRLTKTHSFSGFFQNMLTSPQNKSILEPYPTDFLKDFKSHGKQPYPPCCSSPTKRYLPCPLCPNNSRFHLRPVKATAPCIRQSRRNLKNAQLGLDECRVLIGILWQCYHLVSREIPKTSRRTRISILLPHHSPFQNPLIPFLFQNPLKYGNGMGPAYMGRRSYVREGPYKISNYF